MFKSILFSTLFAFSFNTFATVLAPVDKLNAIKVIGHWKQYNVYGVDSSDLGLDIPPFNIGDSHFQSDLAVADAMTPVDATDINKNGVRCEFLCVNPSNQVIGYNPIIYANELAMLNKSFKVKKK